MWLRHVDYTDRKNIAGPTDQFAGIVILIRIAFLTPNLEKTVVCHIYHTRSAVILKTQNFYCLT